MRKNILSFLFFIISASAHASGEAHFPKGIIAEGPITAQAGVLGNSSTATTATNIAGGTTGGIPYQSASGSTSFLALGTAGQVMTVNTAGTGISWKTPAAGGGGGGGGGGSLKWTEPNNAAFQITEDSSDMYAFGAGLAQNIQTSIRVPSSYVAGNPISLYIPFYSSGWTSGTNLMTVVATLIRPGTDAMTVTTNQRTSTNTAVTPSASEVTYVVTFDLTDSTGHINGVALAAGHEILINLTRGTDTDTSEIRGLVHSTEITFQ
jgi:hypothetical protein